MSGRWLILAALVWSPPSQTSEWRVSHGDSRLGFVATWQGTPFVGVFHRYRAAIRFDPGDLAHSRFVVDVDVTSADLDSRELYDGMADPDWFHFARYPGARFETTGIRAAPTGFAADGRLTVKGVTLPLRITFNWTADEARAQLEGRGRLRRSDFGVGTGEWASTEEIGDDVEVRVDLHLRRQQTSD